MSPKLTRPIRLKLSFTKIGVREAKGLIKNFALSRWATNQCPLFPLPPRA